MRLCSRRFLSRNHEPLKQFDQINGPKALPLIGNLWRYLPLVGNYGIDTLFENAQYNKKRYGPIVREKITSQHTILHLFDPNDIEALFRQDGKYPHRRSHRALLKYRRDRPELYRDGGLFPENGPDWFRQRSQFQHRMMSRSQVMSKIPTIDAICSGFVAKIETRSDNKDSILIDDLAALLYEWSLGSSLALFLDLHIDSIDADTVVRLHDQMHYALKAIDGTEIQSDRWVKHPNRCPFYKMLTKSQDFLYDFVDRRLHKSLDPNSYPHDWLHKDKIDRRDVASFIVDLLLAGLHTSSYTVAHFLYHVTQRSDLLTKLRREPAMSAAGPLSQSHLSESPLLKDCLRETMRLNPVSIGTGRYTAHEYSIRGHLIPKGVMVIAQTQTSSRDESIYDNANSFRPERWAEYRSLPREQRPSPFASLPFGHGTRVCIGRRIADLQNKIMVAKLLKNYDIKFWSPIKTKTTLVHNIDGKIKVNMTKVNIRTDLH